MLLRSRAADDTRAIATAIASVMQPGDVVVLDGGLGVGKTTFVQGAVEALGSRAAVTSPTFAIVQQYTGAPTGIAHVDAYRLDRVQELHDIGFDDLFDGSTIVFVEWGERVRSVLPDEGMTVTLAMCFDEDPGPGSTEADTRTIAVEYSGESWRARDAALRHVLAPYEEPG